MNVKGGGPWEPPPFSVRLMEDSGDEVDGDSRHCLGPDHYVSFTGRA